MNQQQPDDVDDVLGSLFAAERRHEGPPAGTQQRVQAAVLASIAASAAVSSGAVASTAAVSSASSGATAGSGGSALAGLSGAAAILKPAGFVAAAVVATAGGSVFVAQYEVSPQTTPSPAVVVVVPPVPRLPPAGLIVERPLAKAPAAPAKVHSAAVEQVQRAVPVPAPPLEAAAGLVETPAERTARLAGERALIAEARAALSRDDAGGALVALEAHRGAHPQGALAEEREAMTVMALARAGRIDEARSGAAKFKASWPQSIFGPALASALQDR